MSQRETYDGDPVAPPSELQWAFELARDNPGFRVIIVTKNRKEIEARLLNFALEFAEKFNRTKLFFEFSNGSWVRHVDLSNILQQLHGVRADMVLLDLRATQDHYDSMRFVVSKPGNPGMVLWFAVESQ